MMPVVSGSVKPGFEPLAEAFAEGFAGRPTMGAALSVRVAGEVVVDLWGGVADERDGRAWTGDTPSVVFSCTKGLLSILSARLVQEGRLAYDAPVSRYWPEFAAAGKAEVTVGEALSHRAGLSATRADLTEADIVDWARMTEVLAAQEPLWRPGTGYAYHAITHGLAQRRGHPAGDRPKCRPHFSRSDCRPAWHRCLDRPARWRGGSPGSPASQPGADRVVGPRKRRSRRPTGPTGQ